MCRHTCWHQSACHMSSVYVLVPSIAVTFTFLSPAPIATRCRDAATGCLNDRRASCRSAQKLQGCPSAGFGSPRSAQLPRQRHCGSPVIARVNRHASAVVSCACDDDHLAAAERLGRGKEAFLYALGVARRCGVQE